MAIIYGTKEGKDTKAPPNGVRMVPGGELRPWKEFCLKFGHYFRKDGTCVCGKKQPKSAAQKGAAGKTTKKSRGERD